MFFEFVNSLLQLQPDLKQHSWPIANIWLASGNLFYTETDTLPLTHNRNAKTHPDSPKILSIWQKNNHRQISWYFIITSHKPMWNTCTWEGLGQVSVIVTTALVRVHSQFTASEVAQLELQRKNQRDYVWTLIFLMGNTWSVWKVWLQIRSLVCSQNCR